MLRDGRLTLLAYTAFPLDALPGDRFRSADGRFDFHFARADVGGMVLHDRDDLGRPISCPASIAASPDDAALASYAGRYHSDELNTTYTITATADGLTLERRKYPARALVPTVADGFATDHFQLAFTRDEARQIDGFTLLHPHVRRLRFARLS